MARKHYDETSEAMDEMRAYVNSNALNPTDLGHVVF